MVKLERLVYNVLRALSLALNYRSARRLSRRPGESMGHPPPYNCNPPPAHRSATKRKRGRRRARPRSKTGNHALS